MHKRGLVKRVGTTIKDIAKAANVSPSTVSRVIANNPRISKETSENIRKIMEKMNYYPNMIARSLARRSTKIFAVLLPGDAEKTFLNPFFPEILRGITSASHKNDYKVLISGVVDVAEEKKVIREFTRSGIAEGIILMTSRVADPAITELKKLNFPFVIVGKPEKDKEINWVDNNNYEISYELTKHLIGQGHKKIAFLGVCLKFFYAIDRMLGYKQALKDSGLPIAEDLIVESKFREDNGYELMRKLLDTGHRPTAVIACDDLLAIGALKSIAEHELSVPFDIAVAGFNNVPLSEYCTPPLTSVEINPYGLGAKAVELLMANIKSEHKSFDRAIIPAKLVIRKSTLR